MKARTFLGGETTTCAQEEANILDDVCVCDVSFFLSLFVLLLWKSLGFNTLSLTDQRIILVSAPEDISPLHKRTHSARGNNTYHLEKKK